MVKAYKIESLSKMHVYLNRNNFVIKSIIKGVLDIKKINNVINKDNSFGRDQEWENNCNNENNCSKVIINLILPNKKDGILNNVSLKNNQKEKNKKDFLHKNGMLFKLRAFLITSYLERSFIQNG